MKPITLTLLIFFTFNSIHAQEVKIEYKDHRKLKFEAAILPLLFFNSIDMGLSIKHNEIIESKLNFGASIYWAEYSRGKSLKITYNINLHFNNNGFYIPLWVRSKSHWGYGYEEQYFPNALRYSIGTGIGRIFDLDKISFLGENLLFRTEIGLGYSVQKTSRGNPFLYQNYKFDTTYPDHYPKYVPALRLKINVIF